MTKVLIFGVSGMLGSTLLRYFSGRSDMQVIGTIRNKSSLRYLPSHTQEMVMPGVDVDNFDDVDRLIKKFQPTIVLNCVGIVKQLVESNDPVQILPINSIFPHKLAQACATSGSRLIHISTDCVFTGGKGMYLESDPPDAQDLYGISKRLGEVDYPNALTLRTSIIGHELNSSRSLIDWFLSQHGQVTGFKRAIFSGLPTIEVARVISEFVIPSENLTGGYHLSADPISKFHLLSLVASVYQKNIMIKEDNGFVINRSLDSARFRKATGYIAPSWESLIRKMYDFS